MTTLILATRNSHKAQEIRDILADRFCYLTLNDFPAAPKVMEDADSFAGNATKKSLQLAKWISQTPSAQLLCSNGDACILADDSGLEVDALNGAPGVFSARFAAENEQANSSDYDNNLKLMRLLKDCPIEKRTARFRCVLALTPIIVAAQPSQSPVCLADEAELRTELFDGTCEGRIAFVSSGQGGFGYDPIFVPCGFDKSFAELGEEEKNKISHRAKALQKFLARLKARK